MAHSRRRAVLPEQWARFRDHLPADLRDRTLVDAYARLLASPDPVLVDAAARAWCDWEDALIAHETGGRRSPRYDDTRFRRGLARLITHYFSNGAWLADDQLLAGAAHLATVRACSSTAGSTCAVAWRRPGSCTGHARAAS